MKIDLKTYGDAAACIHSLEDSRREILTIAEALDDATFTDRPDPDVWSPALILEHVALAEGSAARVIRLLRRTGGTAVPLPGQVRQGRTTPDGRPIAPDPVSPKGEMTRERVLESLESNRAGVLAELEQSGDLLEAPGGFPHPFFGPLNILGWLRFLAWHEPHHIAQLQRVLKKESL
jgi:hypothetical protein